MAELAIKGGKPLRQKPFPPWPQWGEEELQGLKEVLESRRWYSGPLGGSPGTKAEAFGRAFADFCGVRHGVLLPNGSISLEVALRALGVGPGDEVIVPAYTFISTGTSALMVNAIPVVVDIEPETYCLDPVGVEAAITDRTRAIIAVHLGGQMADMDRLLPLARAHGLPILEDAAQAIGSVWRGRRAGSLGRIASFSFQANKVITSGEGGAIVTDDGELAELCTSLRSFGRREMAREEVTRLSAYESFILSSNYRVSEFQGAVLLAQLARFPRHQERRTKNTDYLTGRLEDVPGIEHVSGDGRTEAHGYYYYIMRYDPKAWEGLSRDDFLRAMRAEGIPLHPGEERPIHRHIVFLKESCRPRGCPLSCPYYGREVNVYEGHFPVAERACRESLILRHEVLLGERGDMDDIADAMLKLHSHLDELRSH